MTGLKHISKTLKMPSPTKGKARRKQGKAGVSKRKVVIPAVEQYALKGKFIFKYSKEDLAEEKKEGRPTVMTADVVSKLEVSFSYDATVEEACLDAGISKDSYYRFIKKFPQFSDRVDELRQAPYLVLRKKVIAEGEHNADTALRFLERKKKGEFSPRTEVAHSGDIINRHSIEPETAALIKQAMGGFARKVAKIAEEKKAA